MTRTVCDRNKYLIFKSLAERKKVEKYRIREERQLPTQAQKQEKLLKLYRELITVKDVAISIVWNDAEYFGTEMEEEEKDLEKQIKELENGS